MPTITAKFPSTCPACKTSIEVGSRVNWERGQKATHVKCPAVSEIGTYSVEVKGDELRAKLDTLRAELALLETVVLDEVLEVTGDAPAVCARCEGKGVLTKSINVSDTLDYSDFRTFVATCPRSGAALGTEYPPNADRYALPFLTLDGVRVESETKNAMCEAELRALWKYEAHRSDVTRATYERHPNVASLKTLIDLTARELTIRRGDVVTVINRGKEYTGRAVWIGESNFGPVIYQGGWAVKSRANVGESRVKVELADGTSKGGALATAKLVSREVVLSVPKAKAV